MKSTLELKNWFNIMVKGNKVVDGVNNTDRKDTKKTPKLSVKESTQQEDPVNVKKGPKIPSPKKSNKSNEMSLSSSEVVMNAPLVPQRLLNSGEISAVSKEPNLSAPFPAGARSVSDSMNVQAQIAPNPPQPSRANDQAALHNDGSIPENIPPSFQSPAGVAPFPSGASPQAAGNPSRYREWRR